MSQRIFLAPSTALEEAIATIMTDERVLESYWSHPNCPVLIFADNALPGSSVEFHGGPVGTDLPVQLIYWGEWWNSPAGAARRAMITDRTQRLINSDYFSELAQYGVNRPTWRQPAIICTKPYPPGSFTSEDEQHVVPDLIDDLIDDDVFPDPDDERIAFVVLMGNGFTQTIGANGAHTYDFDQDFLERDYYWVAWVRYFAGPPAEDPEDTSRTVSHELVEMFTNPEGDAWYVGSSANGEIGDAAVSADGTKQSAWVNGARASAYWSNRHAATVLPIDRDYKARIRERSPLPHAARCPARSRPTLRKAGCAELCPPAVSRTATTSTRSRPATRACRCTWKHCATTRRWLRGRSAGSRCRPASGP